MTKQHAALAGIVLLLAGVVVLGCQMWRVLAVVHDNVTNIQKDLTRNLRNKAVQKLEASWTSSGITHKVTTEREAGETDAAFLARHNAVVEAQKDVYPPD